MIIEILLALFLVLVLRLLDGWVERRQCCTTWLNLAGRKVLTIVLDPARRSQNGWSNHWTGFVDHHGSTCNGPCGVRAASCQRQPTGNMEDMKKLLTHAASGNVSIHLAQAKIRFNPDLDPMTVYRSYGISGPDEE
jgi:hypothetical protein